ALFRDLSISVVAAVGASLILALTLMPVLLTWGRDERRETRDERRETRDERGEKDDSALLETTHVSRLSSLASRLARLRAFGGRLADMYESGMEWSLARPGAVFGIAIATTLATF